jgi:hypothetical protein
MRGAVDLAAGQSSTGQVNTCKSSDRAGTFDSCPVSTGPALECGAANSDAGAGAYDFSAGSSGPHACSDCGAGVDARNSGQSSTGQANTVNSSDRAGACDSCPVSTGPALECGAANADAGAGVARARVAAGPCVPAFSSRRRDAGPGLAAATWLLHLALTSGLFGD